VAEVGRIRLCLRVVFVCFGVGGMSRAWFSRVLSVMCDDAQHPARWESGGRVCVGGVRRRRGPGAVVQSRVVAPSIILSTFGSHGWCAPKDTLIATLARLIIDT
jgi:hypothetical protein